MVVEVELLARYLSIHVDGDNGFVIPLGSRLHEEKIAVEDEGCHGVASGTEKESPSAKFALVHILIAQHVLRTHLI